MNRLETLKRMQAVRAKYADEMDKHIREHNDPEYQLAKARFWAADAVIDAFLEVGE